MKKQTYFYFLITVILAAGCSAKTSPSKLSITGSINSSSSIFKGFSNSLNMHQAFDPHAAAGNVSSVTFRIRKMYISTHTDCSDPVLVANHGTDGIDFDMAQNPTLFTGDPADGTYVCVMVGMDDIITWKPDATAQTANAGCDPNTSQTFDIYRTDSGDSPNWKTYDGTNITATGSGSTIGRDAVYLFASTNASELAAGSIAPHSNQTVTLANSLTVPGSAVFYSSFSGQVSGTSTTCDLNGVTFGFR